ncbi:hypothetical protein AVEN_38355-1 [Araneus ventricosus]|uniref:Uncharacterized protein n=1 Tax=Araneus ventricosus TaxID=182803 RepID=A0A4Y2GSR2_ARAVE|nr:hypothetical protein AVEN_38355-1 [Araneus ventricosus]
MLTPISKTNATHLHHAGFAQNKALPMLIIGYKHPIWTFRRTIASPNPAPPSFDPPRGGKSTMTITYGIRILQKKPVTMCFGALVQLSL